jgi:hypothetical protein
MAGDWDELKRLYGDIPMDAIAQRATLWPVVNWLLVVRLAPTGTSDDMFARKSQPLPTVPRIGEWRDVLDRPVQIERVQWDNDGRVIVRLRTVELAYDALDQLRADGWTVFPRDEPEDWLARAMSDG